MKELQGTYLGSLLDGNNIAVYGWVEASGTTSIVMIPAVAVMKEFKADDVPKGRWGGLEHCQDWDRAPKSDPAPLSRVDLL